MNLKTNALKVLLALVDAKHLNEVQLCASLNHNTGERSACWERVAGVRAVVAGVCVASVRAAVARIACKSGDNYSGLSAFTYDNAGVCTLILSCRNSNNNRLFSLGMSGNIVEIGLECLRLYVVGNLLAHSTLNTLKKTR